MSFIKKVSVVVMFLAAAVISFSASADPVKYYLTIDNQNKMLSMGYVKFGAKPMADWISDICYNVEEGADIEVSVFAPGGYVFTSEKMQSGWELQNDNHSAQYLGKMPSENLNVMIPTLVEEAIPPTPDEEKVSDGKVCRIGPESVDGHYFNTLADAFACCGDSDATITLITDFNAQVEIPAGVKATLDINGHTITTSSKVPVVNRGDLVIENRGMGGGIDGDALVNYGKLWILSGTYHTVTSSGGGRTHFSGGVIVHYGYSSGAGSELVISGGDIGLEQGVLPIQASEGGTLKVIGGAFAVDPSTYVETGCGVEFYGKGLYHVSRTDGKVCMIEEAGVNVGEKYATLEQALTAINGGPGKIKLLSQYNASSTIQVDGKTSVVIDLNGFDVNYFDEYDGTPVFEVQEGGTLEFTNSAVAVGAVAGINGVKCDSYATLKISAGRYFSFAYSDSYAAVVSCGSTTITGGDFSGFRPIIASSGSLDIQGGRCQGDDSSVISENAMVTISGGSYFGTCFVRNEMSGSITISGGYFTTDYSESDLLALEKTVKDAPNGYVAQGLLYKVGDVPSTFFYYVGMDYAGWKVVLANDDELTDTLCVAQETPADELFDDLSKTGISTYAELWEYVDTMLQSKDGYNFDLVVDGDGFLRIPSDYPIDGFVLFNGDIVVESGKEVVAYDLGDDEKPSAIEGDTYPLDPKKGAMVPDYDYTGANCLKSDSAEPPTPPSGYADDAAAVLDGKACRIGPEVSGEYFNSLAAALFHCGDSGMTITLIRDYEGDVTVNPGVKATINLNGKVLTPSSKGTDNLVNLGALVLEDRVGDGQVVGDGIINSGNLWVRSGTVKGISCDAGRAHISGGLITGPVSTIAGGVEMVISGGDIRSTLSAFSDETIKITGGNFYSNPESYLVSGYSAQYDGKIQYSVSPTDGYVCEIVGGSKYTSLSAAFNAVGDSETIRLLKSIVVDASVVVGQKTMPTLDLNGFNIECVADYAYAIVVPVGASLAITNTTVAIGAVRGVSGAVHCEGGELVINGGEFYGQKALYATIGNIAVHGGRFEGNSAFCFEDIAMTIDGGLFKGSITDLSKSANVSITGGYFSSDPSSYVGGGHVVVTPESAYCASGYIANVVPVFFYYVGGQYAGWKAVLADDDGLSNFLSLVQETPADELFAMLSHYDISTYAGAWAFIDARLQSTDDYNFDCEVDSQGFLVIPRNYPISQFALVNGEIVVESGKEVVVYALESEEKPSAIGGSTYPLDPKMGAMVPDYDYTGANCLKSDSAEPPTPPPPVATYTVTYMYQPYNGSNDVVAINTTYIIRDIKDFPDASNPSWEFIGWSTDSKTDHPDYQPGDKVFNLGVPNGTVKLYAIYRSEGLVSPAESHLVIGATDAEDARDNWVTIVPKDARAFTEKSIDVDQYKTLFKKTVTEDKDKGGYVVTIELTDAGLATVQNSVNQAANQITDEFRQISANHDRKVTVTITDGVPGIYYSVQSSASLEKPEWSDSTSERVLCAGDGTFTVTLPYQGSPDGTDQQYYKFRANLTKDGEQ